MLRVLSISAVMVVGVIIETTILTHLSLFGVLPNIMLILITSYGILRGDEEGAVAGLGGGLLRDIAFGQAMGLFAVLGLLAGHIAGKPFRSFYRDGYLLPMLTTGILNLLYSLLLYVFNSLTIAHVSATYYISNVVIPETIYTMLFSIPIYRIFYGINQKIESQENRKRKVFTAKQPKI